jgi:hypothetical protein
MLKDRAKAEESVKASTAAKHATVESDSDDSDHVLPMRQVFPSGDLARGKRREHPAKHGPRFEFFTSDDFNTPPHILEEENRDENREDQEIDFQPALLWRGPASSTTSSRARARVGAAMRVKSLVRHIAPAESETKLDESFIRSLDKAFALGMLEYQRTGCFDPEGFKETLSSWRQRISDAKTHNIGEDDSPGLRRLHTALSLRELFGFFVPVEDESPLSQKYQSVLVNLVKVQILPVRSVQILTKLQNEASLSNDVFLTVAETVKEASTTMKSLRIHLKKLYPYGRPNFYIPQSLLDAFALILVMIFSMSSGSLPKECLVRLDNALPVNISPFERNLANFTDPGQLLSEKQDLTQSIIQGFRSAKMELLVNFMFRPELPLLTRTTTYEVADAEALLILIIEHVCLSIGNIKSVNLEEDCKETLTFLV